jgi:phage tail-like protein
MAIFETFDDLVPGYKFDVDIPGFGSVNFSEVDGLGLTAVVQKYREGGTTTSKELYLGVDYTDIVLRRGVSSSTQLWDFAQHPMGRMQQLKDVPYIEPSSKSAAIDKVKVKDFRVEVVIKQRDNFGKIVKQWRVHEAWVKDFRIGTLSADRSEVSIESITLSHAGLTLEEPGKFTGSQDIPPQGILV